MLKVGDFVKANKHNDIMTVNKVWESENPFEPKTKQTWCECSWVGTDSEMRVCSFLESILTKV